MSGSFTDDTLHRIVDLTPFQKKRECSENSSSGHTLQGEYESASHCAAAQSMRIEEPYLGILCNEEQTRVLDFIRH